MPPLIQNRFAQLRAMVAVIGVALALSLSPYSSAARADKFITPHSNRNPETCLLAQNNAADSAAEKGNEGYDDEWDDEYDDAYDTYDDELDNGDQPPPYHVRDPLSGFNRVIFHINDNLYYGVMRPVTAAYKALIPATLRTGLMNFFHNLTSPLRIVNCLLQGKGEAADHELVRFAMNSTIGVLGFGNPAKKYPELEPSGEDLGQTLGSWGIGNGFYLVLPVLGPSTLRDSVGLLGDHFMSPVTYIRPEETSWEVWAGEKVNTLSFYLGDYESLRDAALDPYEAFRDAYLQHRYKELSR
jgi:phospholipid-binding lipoprotein MlaA